MISFVFVIKVDQNVTVHAIRSQQYENKKIGNQQHQIKRIDLIKSLKSSIQKMRADILPNAAIGQKHCQNERRIQRTKQRAPFWKSEPLKKTSILPDQAEILMPVPDKRFLFR